MRKVNKVLLFHLNKWRADIYFTFHPPSTVHYLAIYWWNHVFFNFLVFPAFGERLFYHMLGIVPGTGMHGGQADIISALLSGEDWHILQKETCELVKSLQVVASCRVYYIVGGIWILVFSVMGSLWKSSVREYWDLVWVKDDTFASVWRIDWAE